ncbi:phenylalanine--tRNA ligase subunit beta [Blastopirellula marina]|uniref:Phenylalanine--tRNA ligase beta subunit n=1 Tax=Blastopirellula marina TaxID=124 RepID=A0A2S8GJD8_9BACT|nr:phenylalanine--tRNA ligase subunit beta [Blastopirellula marina]PQO44577.1 phenylalanine--tRNA ligase subunit beta [Blastopirellula marina]
MLVSWEWLKRYLDLNISEAEVCDRLTLAGLNFDGASTVANDRCLDLEVTSNRPDWLGHIGIAREVGVLFDLDLKIPQANISDKSHGGACPKIVQIEDEEFCPRYIARSVYGVTIGPSPAWLANHLETIGITVINNVVDVTNYVLMEIGQPLHAFDLDKIAGDTITVRKATSGEKFQAIDHRDYELHGDDYVIADKSGPIALAGVMGGKLTEVDDTTHDLLIEAADFAALPVRTTSRRLKLKSDSSYRFERGVDPEMLDWASRRCCELIVETAGGEISEGSVFAGSPAPKRKPVTLRYSQLKRILGIEVPEAEVRRILEKLGNPVHQTTNSSITVIPASWRRDIEREVDLVEEVARIYGYDQIPEHAGVSLSASHRSDLDRVRDKVRGGMLGMGFDETLTRSVVSDVWAKAFQGWSLGEPLTTSMPMVKGEDRLRISLLPSLLGARRNNEKFSYSHIDLYEIAKVYLPKPGALPDERYMVGITSGKSFYEIKGIVEALIATLNPNITLQAIPYTDPMFEEGQGCHLTIDGTTLGYLGVVSGKTCKAFGLQRAASVAELDLGALMKLAILVPQHQEFSTHPAMNRDLNLIVDEGVSWAALQEISYVAGGPLVANVAFQEIFRDPRKDGHGKKRVLFTITLQAFDRTLTGEEADKVIADILAQCDKQTGAKLLA